MINNYKLIQLSKIIGLALKKYNATITTAESCTGGWIAKIITDIPGSSLWFRYGFITYSDKAKIQMIGVRRSTIEQYGAISKHVVKEMAIGALQTAKADYAISVSGIAGPNGDKNNNILSIGTIWFGFFSTYGKGITSCKYFGGSRENIRLQAVKYALKTFKQNFLQDV